MKTKKVIGFVGLPGSGKSTLLDAIKKLGAIVTMGDVVRNEVKRKGLKIDPSLLGETASQLRKDHGEQIIAKKCVGTIKKMEETVIFVDGIRSKYEVKYFKKFWDFPIIAILCPEEIRHKRLMERGRFDDSVDLDNIVERDKRENGFGLKNVINKADFNINNNSDLESLIKKTKKLLHEIL